MSKGRHSKNPIDESNEILQSIKKGGNPFVTEPESSETIEAPNSPDSIEEVQTPVAPPETVAKISQNIVDLPESTHGELADEDEDEYPEPEMLPSKYLSVYNEKAQPTTINVTRLDFFSALSKGEVEEHIPQEIRERHSFMKAGVMAVFKNTNEGVLFFGIDYSILDDYVREYEASFE